MLFTVRMSRSISPLGGDGREPALCMASCSLQESVGERTRGVTVSGEVLAFTLVCSGFCEVDLSLLCSSVCMFNASSRLKSAESNLTGDSSPRESALLKWSSVSTVRETAETQGCCLRFCGGGSGVGKGQCARCIPSR